MYGVWRCVGFGGSIYQQIHWFATSSNSCIIKSRFLLEFSKITFTDKMLNSENIIWRAKFVDIYFLSRGKFMSCSLDFQFLIFLKRSINFESFDVLMSICEIEYVFWIILWIVNCFDIKLDQLIDIVICNIFKRNLALFEGLIPNCYRNYCYY